MIKSAMSKLPFLLPPQPTKICILAVTFEEVEFQLCPMRGALTEVFLNILQILTFISNKCFMLGIMQKAGLYCHLKDPIGEDSPKTYFSN